MTYHKTQLMVLFVLQLSLLQTSDCISSHVLNFFDYSGAHLGLMGLFLSLLWLIYFGLCCFFTLSIFTWFRKLGLSVSNSILAHCETSKQECENRVLKEPLLCLFAIFIHCIPYGLELHGWARHKFLDLLLLKMMRKHYWKHGRCEYIIGFVRPLR